MSKPIKVMITILISLTIIGIATIVILVYGDQGSVSSEERTIETWLKIPL